jgi:Concanavalin A-like lectin/glucanases superfamily/HYR domain
MCNKSIYILFLLIATGARAQQPLAYYKFDKDAVDYSGNNNHGTIKGSVTPAMDRFGHPCGAMQFDGSTGYIEVPSSASLESPQNSITITVWYRLSQANRINAWLTAVCKGYTSNEKGNPQYRLQVQQNTSSASPICKNANGSGTISINTEFTKCDNNFTAHPLPIEEWAFYAVVYDGSRVAAYMNDQKIFEQSYSGIFSLNTSPLFIGIDEPGLNEFYSGAMDDLRIYKDALSESQILSLYQESRPERFNVEEFTLDMMPNRTLYVGKNGCTTTVNFVLPAPNSDCGTVTVRQTEGPLNGDKLGPGSYKVSIEAISTTGYEQSTGFNITVADTIRPVLKRVKDTTVFIAKGKRETPVIYALPLATDNCGVKTVQLETGLACGADFPLGENIVRYKAVDVYGNAATGSFRIIVKEKREPILPPPPPQLPPQPPVRPVDTSIVKNPATTRDTTTEPIPPKPPVTVDSIKKPVSASDTIIKIKLSKPKEYQDTVYVDSPVLMLELYDNAEVDQDTATVFLNSKMIIEKQMLSARAILKEIEIDTAIDNELILYAENLGSIPPNTATLIVVDGHERHAVNLRSDVGYSGTVIIRKKRAKGNK